MQTTFWDKLTQSAFCQRLRGWQYEFSNEAGGGSQGVFAHQRFTLVWP
jgi:hypothetical protein